MGAATILVNFGVVIFTTVDKVDRGAELFENCFINNAGGAIRAVHAEMKSVKIGELECG